MASCLTLKKSNCKNCYKCIRSCPVKSIRFSANQAHIIDDECILCGTCFVVCPQNAKRIIDSTEIVQIMIKSHEKVIASVAPSFIANYPGCSIDSLREALKKLGFYDAQETAIGATVVKKEYDRILNEENRDIVISSCCHSVNLLIQKYFPDCLPYLADVLSPMQAHSMLIKKENPGVKTVFIGPCVAKKDEAARYGGYVDAVLTFEELSNWMQEEGIEPEARTDSEDNSRARMFPTTGGILHTMEKKATSYTYLAIDGVRNCISALKDIQQGTVHKCFIEMSACSGSCIGGPVMGRYHRNPVSDYKAVSSYAGAHDYIVAHTDITDIRKEMQPISRKDVMPDEEQIKEILKKMGKTLPAHELNCGSCGYDTCREKAIAIFRGKADISMCLPYLKEKAESFSDTIVKNTPNGLIVLNDVLEVQQINRAACRILNIPSASDIIGEPVVRILDPSEFYDAMEGDKELVSERTYLAEYDKYVEKTIVKDKDSKMLICIITDVTKEEKEHIRKEEISRETVKVADKVVDKQMRIVQEIAYLLGETAAETKIALSKLKESISDE